MTNLLPRLQFRTPGLNRNVTPTTNTTTPKDHGKIRKRQSFNSYSWLSDSSVIHVYDVSSTNTRRILRNDNYGKTSRLRQHDETDFKRLPDPGTQSRASFTKNPQVQKQSHNSISLYNEHETPTDTESFRSNNQRPRTRFPVQTAVNQKRHTSCAVSIDPAEFSPGMTTYIQWQRRLVSQRINMIFNNPEKPSRTKLNLYRAERTYSSRNLMELKRKQYIRRLNQNRRAFQGVHGNQEYVYLKYMRYINQSKTAPLPSKLGWRRPKWLPKLVTSGESTKDNSQKQRTTDKKVCSSSNVLQKSHSDKFGKSKPEIKTQANTEMQKHKSSKELVFTDQAVNVIRRPQRSKPSSLRSPNGPSKRPTNSGSQESTENREDVQSKGELKDAVEIGAKVERDNSDKPLSSGDKNQQRQTITKEEVDITMSLPGHVSPNGSINDTLYEQDYKSKDLEQRDSTDEINKKNQEHESRLSAVERPESRKSTFIKDHEKMQDEDQTSNDFKHREFADEMNKKSQEHDSSPLAVESPESEKNTSSKVHEISQEKEQLTHCGQSEYVDEMNKKSHDHSRPLAAESPESGKGTSSKAYDTLHEEDYKSIDSEQQESTEINKMKQEYESRLSAVERPESRKSTFIKVDHTLQEKDQMSTDLEQRESADEINKRGQEHDTHLSTIGRPESGNRNSTNVLEPMQEDDQKSTGLEEREHVEEMNKKRQEHSSHSSSVERPESGKNNSTNVPVKLQEEDEKSTELKQREYADEMDRTSQEHDNGDSPAERPDLVKETSNGVPVKLQEEEEKSTELEQRESADEIDRNSQEHDNHDSPAERPDAAKKTSNEVHENLEDEDRKSRSSTVKRPESGKNTFTEGKDLQTQASINGLEENKILINQQTGKLEK